MKLKEGEKLKNEEDPNDRGSLIVLTSMTKGNVVEYMLSLMSKVKDEQGECRVSKIKYEHVEYMASKIKDGQDGSKMGHKSKDDKDQEVKRPS